MGLANTPWPKIYGDNRATCNTQYSNINPKQTSCIYLQDLFGTPKYLWCDMGCLIDTDETLYLAVTDGQTYMACINPDKTPKWLRAISGSYDIWWDGPVLDNEGRLYIGTENGDFYCINKNTGEINWTFYVPLGPPGDPYPDNYIWSTPVVAPDNTVIFASWQLYCFYPNGVQKWTRWFGVNNPSLYEKQIGLGDNGLLYAAPWPKSGQPAHIYAINIEDGSIVHTWTDPDGPRKYYDGALDRCPPVITSDSKILASTPYGGTSEYLDWGEGRVWCFSSDLTPIWDIDLYPLGYWCHPLGAVGLSPDEETYYMFDWWGLCFSFNIPTGSINWVINRYAWPEFGGTPEYVEAPIAIDPTGNLYLPFHGERADNEETSWLTVLSPTGTIISNVELIGIYGDTHDDLFAGPSIAPSGNIHLFTNWGYWFILGVASASKIHYWNKATNQWEAGILKVWDGSTWVTKPVKYWDGTAWKT